VSDIFNPPTFGTLLRKARLENALTLREAAKRAGMDAGNLSKYENLRLAPPRSAIEIRRMFARINPKFSSQFAVDLAFSFHLGVFRKEFYE